MNTYDDPIWLCRLFVVFALGELYSERATRTKGGRGVPGTAFFLQAMSILQDLHEEPTIPYIETLLLIVSCPWSSTASSLRFSLNTPSISLLMIQNSHSTRTLLIDVTQHIPTPV